MEHGCREFSANHKYTHEELHLLLAQPEQFNHQGEEKNERLPLLPAPGLGRVGSVSLGRDKGVIITNKIIIIHNYQQNLSKLLLLGIYPQYPPAQGFVGNSPSPSVHFFPLGVVRVLLEVGTEGILQVWSCCETKEIPSTPSSACSQFFT